MPDDSTSTSAIPLIAGSLVLAALFLLAGISLSDGWTERFARAYRRSSRKWRLRAKARRVQRESERLRRDLQAIAAASPAQKMARHPEEAEFEPEPEPDEDKDEGEKAPDPYSPIFVVVIPQAASQPRPGTLLQEDEPTGLNLQDAVERRMLVRYLCGDFGKVWE